MRKRGVGYRAMPTYTYYCKKCDANINHKEPMMDEHRTLACPICRMAATRVYQGLAFHMSDKKAKKELTGWRKGVW